MRASTAAEASRVPQGADGRIPRWVSALVVVLSAVAVYANTASYGAAWDDTRFVFASGAHEGVRVVPELFRRPMVRDVPPQRSAYRPLTTASYALDWTLSRGRPAFFHKVNIALHALASLLVWGLMLRLGASTLAAGAGGLIFAVHPVHVEAVANIAGRSELLASVWVLIAALVYLSRAAHRVRVPLLTACYALALLSKEHAVVLPALLVALETLRATPAPSDWRRSGIRRIARALAAQWPVWVGLVAVTVAYFAVRLAVLGTLTTADVAPFIGGLPPPARVSTAIANWTIVARLFLLPLDLVVDYGPAVVMPAGPSSLRFWAGLGVGGAALSLAVWGWRASLPLIPSGIVWIAIALFPTSNLLVPIAQWLAERFLYLPSVGFAMAAGVGIVHVTTGLGRRECRMAVAGVALWMLFLAQRTWDRNRTWADSESVIATLITEHPESFRAQWYLGRLRFQQGRLEEAFAALDSASTLQPNAIELPLERAEWLLRLGRYSEAEALLGTLPFGRHAQREAYLVRALAAQGRHAAADSLLTLARAAFPENATLRALSDSLGVGGAGAAPGDSAIGPRR